jgi:hypothetical protein
VSISRLSVVTLGRSVCRSGRDRFDCVFKNIAGVRDDGAATSSAPPAVPLTGTLSDMSLVLTEFPGR